MSGRRALPAAILESLEWRRAQQEAEERDTLAAVLHGDGELGELGELGDDTFPTPALETSARYPGDPLSPEDVKGRHDLDYIRQRLLAVHRAETDQLISWAVAHPEFFDGQSAEEIRFATLQEQEARLQECLALLGDGESSGHIRNDGPSKPAALAVAEILDEILTSTSAELPDLVEVLRSYDQGAGIPAWESDWIQELASDKAEELNDLAAGAFSAVEERIAEMVGVPSLPHPSDVTNELFRLTGVQGAAVEAAAVGGDALDQLLVALRDDWPRIQLVLELANAAGLAGYLLAKATIGTDAASVSARASAGGAVAQKRTAAASVARTNWKRRERAQAVWRDYPTWSTHRVAKAIAGDGEDISSVSRSIHSLAPPSSPSFKPD